MLQAANLVIRGLPEYSADEISAELKAVNLKPVKVFGRTGPGSYRDYF